MGNYFAFSITQSCKTAMIEQSAKRFSKPKVLQTRCSENGEKNV
jgi:hypothetical protein